MYNVISVNRAVGLSVLTIAGISDFSLTVKISLAWFVDVVCLLQKTNQEGRALNKLTPKAFLYLII